MKEKNERGIMAWKRSNRILQSREWNERVKGNKEVHRGKCELHKAVSFDK